jgi:hypothetical protein
VQFFSASRLAIVAGKGGVGKTTVSAVLARAAADVGLRVLLVELEGKPALGELFGHDGPLPYQEVPLVDGLGPAGTGSIRACTLTPPQALSDYLDTHGLRRVTKRLVTSGVIDVVSTTAPGIDDILVLGKLKQLERAAAHVDLIVVDGPAAGHAITFLQAATGLADAVSSGPIATQARDVLELLGDPTRCRVLLVTLPEATPVNELVETAFALEDRVGVQLGPVVVNGVDAGRPLPDDETTTALLAAANDLDDAERVALADAARFRRSRREMQRGEIDRLAQLLPLPQLRVPQVIAAGVRSEHMALLAAELLTSIRGLPS